MDNYNSNDENSHLTLSQDQPKSKDDENACNHEDITYDAAAAQNLKNEGNEYFRIQNYTSAIEKYDEGLAACPPENTDSLSVLFANKAACLNLLEKYEDSLNCCSKTLELNPKYLKAYLRRAVAYEKLEKLDEALEDYKKIIGLDPKNTTAHAAEIRLKIAIQERNEKMKTEMMSKLKDLGNIVLKPFGLSTNNFQVEQNSETGSYSVNFQK